MIIICTYSVLKGAVGIIADKLTIKFSDYNDSNVLRKFSPAIAYYYQTRYIKRATRSFFYNSLNVIPEQEVLTYDMSYGLIQTPYVLGINQKIYLNF